MSDEKMPGAGGSYTRSKTGSLKRDKPAKSTGKGAPKTAHQTAAGAKANPQPGTEASSGEDT